MSDDETTPTDVPIAKPLIAETKICSICLLSGSTDDNDPIVYCDRCGVIVHESCYNADTLDEKSSDSSSPSEYWFCTPCLARVDHPTCALCPTRDPCSAFWPTLESSWIHVVCALAVPGVLFYDELYYTPVDLSNIPTQKFGNKACHLCDLRSGVTVSCDAGLCPNAFHLSCANKNGLLQIRGELSKIECELYCVTHQSTSNAYKKVQRNYTICEVQQTQLDHRHHLSKEISETLDEYWSIYKQRSDSFPKLPKPSKSHVARSLMVDPIALKEFFAKAQRLRPNQSTLLPKHFDLTSTDTNALLAFTANEEELGLIRQNINEAQRKLEQLEATTIDEQLREEQNQLETHLRREYDTLASLTDQYHRYIDIFEKYQCSLKNETRHLLSNMKSAQVSSSRRRTTSTTNNDTGCCSICHQTDRSNQMITCCQCHLMFHGQCLTPAMPSKTLTVILSASKKYDWQCASCVNAQQEELDQCHVNVNEPRQIRPRRTNELVLREAMIKFGSRKRKPESNPTETRTETSEEKRARPSVDPTKRRSSPTLSSTSNQSKAANEETSPSNQSRTSVIKQLLTRKATHIVGESSSASSTATKKRKKPSRISIKKSSTSKSDECSVTPVRSRSLTNECRVPTIFKQKALTVPSDKSSHGKGSTKRRKDPLAIFDFYDDDENDNEIVELRSSITTDDQPGNDDDEPKVNEAHEGEDKSHGKTRRSTLIIVNNVPSDVLCRECQSQGTDANMTDCDQCKHFYHFACCVPPLSSFPKRRNYGWTCHRCNDQSESELSASSSPPLKNSKRDRRNNDRQGEKQATMDV